MSLEQRFLEMLNEREDFTSTQLAPKKSKWDLSPSEAFEEKNVPSPESIDQRNVAWDVLGSALWAFTDEMMFGVPGAAYKRTTGEEFWEPETVAGKVSAGVAGFAGFAAPVPWAPLKVGGVIAKGAAKLPIKAVGKTLSSATRKAVNEVTAKGVNEGAEQLARNLGKASTSWTMMGRWDSKVANNWEKFAGRNIDELVDFAVRKGDVGLDDANIVRNVFKANFKDRPMIDIIDVIMRNRPDRTGFAMGSMIHEATMFGAIDSIMEGVHYWGEKGEVPYDWTAPLWGMGTGAAFGALKFFPGHGKQASTWQDFKTGWTAWAGKDVFSKMDKNKLMNNAKILGNELKNGMNGKSSYLLEFQTKDGLLKTIDLTNPESYLLGMADDEAVAVLRKILKGKQQEIGGLMMKEALWEDLRSSGKNWGHMVAGSMIMNARTILAISQGEDVPLEDIMTSVFLGAFVNRKGGGGKTYDIMQNEMMSLRRSLNTLGVHGKNYIDRFPSGASGSNEPLNPLNYGEFNDVRRIFRDKGITSDNPAAVETMSKDGSESVVVASATAKGDFSLFNQIYAFAHGASGERHIKSRDKITVNEARAIEAEFKKVEYTIDGKTFKLNTIDNTRKALEDISDRLHDRVESEALHSVYEVMSEGGVSYYQDGKQRFYPSNEYGLQNIGFIPKRVKISDHLYAMAEKGQLEWLVDSNGNKLSGKDARYKLTDYQRKLDALFDFMSIIPGRSSYYEGTKSAGYIETSEGLGRTIKAMLTKENAFNKGFKINKPWLKFKMENLEDMKIATAVRYFKKSKDHISETFDTSSESWNAILGSLRDAGILVNSKDGLANVLIQNPFKNIEIKVPEGMQEGDPKLNEAKNFVSNIVSILGAKGQHNVSETGKSTTSYAQVEKLINTLNKFGITNDIKVFNMFAQDVVSDIAYQKVIGTKLTQGDVHVIQELMNLDTPMASYGTQGVAKGFMIKKLKKSNSMSEDLQNAIDAYNKEVDLLVKRGEKKGKEGEGSVIKVIDEAPLLTEVHSIKNLAEMVRRAREKSDITATDHIVDFMNALDPNDSLRNSLAGYMQKYGVSADRMLTWLRDHKIIEPEPGQREGATKYVINIDKMKEGRKLRNDFEKWLEIDYGIRVKDIEHIQHQAEYEANELMNQSRRDTKNNSVITVDGFFKKWFPKFHNKKPFGTKIEDYDTYLTEKLYLDIDHNINKYAIRDIIRDMEFVDSKTGNRTRGTDILTGWDSNPRNRARYFEAAADIMHVLKTRLTTVSKHKIQYIKGKLEATSQVKALTGLDIFHTSRGLDYMIVDGTMHATFDTSGRNIIQKALNIFELESPNISNNRRKELENAKTHFDLLLNQIDFIKGSGVSIIRFGNAKAGIAIPKLYSTKIINLFKNEIYDVYYEKANPAQKEILNEVMNSLKSVSELHNDKADPNYIEGNYKSSQWTKVHKQAYRTLILKDMLVGKDKDLYLESLSWSESKTRDMLSKRFSLFDTKSANRITKDLIDIIPNEMKYKFGYDPTSEYKTRDFGMAVWADKRHGGIQERIESILAKQKLSWDSLTGGRENSTGFDSIGFISKNMKDFLSVVSGDALGEASSFKPIISSSGKDNILLFGKTLFVYDPLIQKDIFDKQAGLDVLLTESADKLQLSTNPINKPIKELLNMTTADWGTGNYMFKIKKESLGLVGYQKEGPAKQSYSLWNFMQSKESAAIYETFYSQKLDRSLQDVAKILSNPVLKSSAFRLIKGIDRDIPLDDLFGSDNFANFSNLAKWMHLSENSRPEAFGEYMLNNALKKQFIDPVLDQSAIIDGKQFGGKTVLSQSFKLRDLDVSTVPKNNRKGEIILPATDMNQSIHFGDKNVKVRVVDRKTGKDKDAYKAFKEILQINDPKMKEKDIKELWLEIANLGELHSIFSDKTFMGEFINIYDIGILTTRYPRTRPNDLALLRLKGFLNKEAGNQAIVNDLDVYSIFEGDYDYDKIDYFWAHDRTTYKHVNRTKQHWLNNIDVSKYEGKAPTGLSVLSKNSTINDDAWNQLDATNRVFSKSIGIAQKTLRIVENLYELAAPYTDINTKQTHKTKRRLIDRTLPNGDHIEIFMDLGTEWYHRQALESQIMIDSWKGVDKRIVDDIMMYRKEFLYPLMDDKISITSDQITESVHPNNRKIRLFRKYKNGKEVDLNKVDKDLLSSMQDNFNNFSELQTQIYEGGVGRSPYYHDMINKSRDYFSHLESLGDNTFYKLVSKYGYKNTTESQYFEDMFSMTSEVRYESKKLIADPKSDFSMDNVRLDPVSHMKMAPKASPFDQVVINKAEAISQGREGSVLERTYRKILDRDPLGHKYTDEMILMGDELKLHNRIMDLAMVQAPWATAEMQELIPKAVTDIKTSKRKILGLINIRDRVKFSTKIPWKLKQARLKALEAEIKKIEYKMGPMLTKDWFKGKEPENFPDVNLVDIYRNKDIREATIQYYTLHSFGNLFTAKNPNQMTKDIRELRQMIGVEYKEINTLQSSTGYGHLTMSKAQIEKFRLDPYTSRYTLEDAIQLKLQEGFRNHGASFLFEFATPKYGGEVNLGVYNGRVMPTVIKPSANYKRILRFMLESMETAYREKTGRGDLWKNLLTKIAERDAHFSNIFSGDLQYIPTDGAQINSMFKNAPDVPNRLNAYIGMRYGDITFRKNILHRHVFGLGHEYDTNISFLNELHANAKRMHDPTQRREIRERTEGISKLHQLTMEGGYMNPISYHLLIEQYKKELGDLGFGKESIAGGYDKWGNQIQINPATANHGLTGLITGDKGVSFDPMRMMSPYKINMLLKFMEQGANVASTRKENGESWKTEWKSEIEGGRICKP